MNPQKTLDRIMEEIEHEGDYTLRGKPDMRLDLRDRIEKALTAQEGERVFVQKPTESITGFPNIEFTAQEGEWISVEDELPNTARKVVIFDGLDVVEAVYYNHPFKVWEDETKYRRYPIHWQEKQPLPTPPKEDK